MPRFKEKENMSSDDIPDDIIALFREKAQVRKFGNVVHGIHALEKKSEPKIVIAEIETYEEFLNEESILIDKSRTSSTSIESFEFSK
jgi:hypothetical protein